jgi:hypothetical protein
VAVLELLGKGQQGADDTLFSLRGNGRKWASALASRSTASPARICFVGDSVTEGLDGSYVDAFRKRIAPLNGFKKGVGFVHASQDVANVFNANKFILTSGTANSPAGQNVEDIHSISTSGWKLASTSVMTLEYWTGPLVTDYAPTSTTAGPIWDTMEFHYTVFGTSGAAGTVTVAIDGVGQTPINTVDTSIGAGNYEIRTVTYTVTRGQHAVTVTGSGGQPSIFGGAFLSDGESVWVYNVGDSGDEFTDMNMSTSGRTIQGLAKIDADCVIWMHGINSFHAGDLAAAVTAASDLETALVNTKAQVADVSLGYGPPYPVQSRTTWPLFVAEWRRVSAKNDVPVCDFSTMLLTNAATTDPFDLIDSGGSIANTHPNASGAEYMADQLARFVGLVGIDWMADVDLVSYRPSLRTLGQGSTQALPGDALSGAYSALFTNTSFAAGLTVTKNDTGKAYLLLRDQKGTATTGTAFEIGFNGYGATQQLGSSGVNGLAWIRGIAPSTWTDSSSPLDFVFGNCASGSITPAERMRLLAGGWLQFSEFAAPAGTASKVAVGSRVSSSKDQFGALMPDSSVRVLASSSFNDPDVDPSMALAPTGVLAASFPRHESTVANVSPFATGQLFLVAIPLLAGTVVTSAFWWSATQAAVTPTHWWFSLHDSALAFLRQTADQTTTAWAATTKKTVAFATTYTATYSGLYYLGFMMAAATVISTYGASSNTNVMGDPPVLQGASTTGLTTTAPAPAGAITTNANRPYCGVL